MPDTAAALLPWQSLTQSCGLTLAAPAALTPDAPALAAEVRAVLDMVPEDQRLHVPPMAGWCSLPLIEPAADGAGRGTPAPALAVMPGFAALLDAAGLGLLQAHLTRMAPGDVLDWHHDPIGGPDQAARLVFPVVTGPGAVTWISHEPHCWPAGTAWAADFSFPHRVVNGTGADRLAIILDLVMDDAARRVVPETLRAEPDRRRDLARQAVNLLIEARAAA